MITPVSPIKSTAMEDAIDIPPFVITSAISLDVMTRARSQERYMAPASAAYDELSMERPWNRNRAHNVNLPTAVYSHSRETSLFLLDRTHVKYSSSAARTCEAGCRLIHSLLGVLNSAPTNSKVVAKVSGLESPSDDDRKVH